MSEETTDGQAAALIGRLRREVGATGTPTTARDPVNQPMIRHWCDAMDDANPLYTDPAAARQGPHGEIVAPPAMLNAWNMTGLLPRPADLEDPASGVYDLLDEAGYEGVVATNCEHVYHRYLKLGDHLGGVVKLVDVSDEKQTALGVGHFVTTETEYHDQHDEHVGSMFFRILKFRPGTGRASDNRDSAAAERPPRPRPSRNQNTDFFWQGSRVGELRIQQCANCGRLQHPPGIRCPACGSTDMGYAVASGRGTLYSHVVAHHPRVPSFDYPLNIGLVELEEGVRLVTNITDCDAAQLKVGMPLEAWHLQTHEDVSLPVFRPARIPRNPETLAFDQVSVGDELPLCPVPLTPTLIVSTAIASRDYQDVHHDRDMAVKKGSEDIFMNILTSSGISARYISDWAGPDAVFKNLKIRLGAPNYPDDCMTMSGSVTAKQDSRGEAVVQVSFRGQNSRGPHVTGTAELALARR
ncbi:MAG: MaoC family dehydratase N-terminal domain-containing protein [bacterium]|nr:MaoC family dehydratase N-terminal domain-containing protein [bacterium]MCY4194205.1 MaoC family dehydratase N-terminal domain-containing protein [bacterium]